MSHAALERADKPRWSVEDFGRLIEGAIGNGSEEGLNTAMQRAGNETDLPALLQQYRVVEEQNIYSLLTFAAHKGFSVGVKYLLDLGASPEVLDSRGFSYLHYLAVQGNAKAMKLVFDPARDMRILNTPSACGHTPLQLACEHAPRAFLYESVSFLLEKGASPHLAYFEKALPIALLRRRSSTGSTTEKNECAKALHLLCNHGALVGRNIEALDLWALISMLPNAPWVFFGASGYLRRLPGLLENYEQFLEWRQQNAEQGSGALRHVEQAIAIYMESLKAPLNMPPHAFVPSSGYDELLQKLYRDLHFPRPVILSVEFRHTVVQEYAALLKFVHALYRKIGKQSDYTSMQSAFFWTMMLAGICSGVGGVGFFITAFLMTFTRMQDTILQNQIGQSVNNTAIPPSIADLEQQHATIPKTMLDLSYALIACLIFAAAGWIFPLGVSYIRRSREESVIAGAQEERQAIDGQIKLLQNPPKPVQNLLSSTTSFFGVHKAIGRVSEVLVKEDLASYKL